MPPPPIITKVNSTEGRRVKLTMSLFDLLIGQQLFFYFELKL